MGKTKLPLCRHLGGVRIRWSLRHSYFSVDPFFAQSSPSYNLYQSEKLKESEIGQGRITLFDAYASRVSKATVKLMFLQQ